MSRRDPGNWATGLAGGAQFGYHLLFVVLLSSVAAMFLQHLALKLGVASGRDLAQACRDAYPRCVQSDAALQMGVVVLQQSVYLRLLIPAAIIWAYSS